MTGEPIGAGFDRLMNRIVRNEVTNGIVCFCGERFGEPQALEFMLHLRAEYGEVLEWRERQRAIRRKYAIKPEVREQRNALLRQQYRDDPEYRARKDERNRQYKRDRRATDPEYRARERQRDRERKARKKVEREAGA